MNRSFRCWHLPTSRLQRVAKLAKIYDVELMTHPEMNVELEALLSDEFANTVSQVQLEPCAIVVT